jgi:flagellar hook assembly protein FlgD
MTIDIRNSEETRVDVAIHNLLGQKIKNLYKGSNKGELMLKWNGANDSGNKVAHGVYLCKMNGQTIKIVYKQ